MILGLGCACLLAFGFAAAREPVSGSSLDLQFAEVEYRVEELDLAAARHHFPCPIRRLCICCRGLCPMVLQVGVGYG